MSARFRRAAAVGLSARAGEAMRGALGEAGCALDGSASDAASGLRLVRALQPDLVVAAAVMSGADGMAFARALREMRLNVRPGVLILCPSGLRLPGESKLAALGTLALDAPPTAKAVQEALTRLEDMEQSLEPAMAERLRMLLDALGVPEHPGRDCLARAVALVWHDRRRLHAMKHELYPAIARRTGMKASQVERAIRHVIDEAWRTGDIEQQHRIFGDTIDARRGKPTSGEMIAQLAEELRWEG